MELKNEKTVRITQKLMNLFKEDVIQYNYNPEDIKRSLKKIRFCDIIEFYQKFLSSMYVKIMFTGNILPEQALKWGKHIHSTLDYKPVSKEKVLTH